MRILQIHHFYPPYLDGFYGARPDLAGAPYAEQLVALEGHGFSAGHLFAEALRGLGHEARLVVLNCAPLQRAWAREQGMAEDADLTAIATAQVDAFAPEVLYLSHPPACDSRFVAGLRRRPRCVAGWRAAPSPPDMDLSGFDLMLTSASRCRDEFTVQGVKVAPFVPGVPDTWCTARLPEPDVDVIFAGSWSGMHLGRNALLTRLARAAAAGHFTLRLHLLRFDGPAIPPEVAVRDAGPVFGVDLLHALARGRICLNASGDRFAHEAPNMRHFEVAAAGRCQLAPRQQSIAEYFDPDREIVLFDDDDQALNLIQTLLADPARCEAVGAAARQRALADHVMTVRGRELVTILD